MWQKLLIEYCWKEREEKKRKEKKSKVKKRKKEKLPIRR